MVHRDFPGAGNFPIPDPVAHGDAQGKLGSSHGSFGHSKDGAGGTRAFPVRGYGGQPAYSRAPRRGMRVPEPQRSNVRLG
jgi:hypothetical protein